MLSVVSRYRIRHVDAKPIKISLPGAPSLRSGWECIFVKVRDSSPILRKNKDAKDGTSASMRSKPMDTTTIPGLKIETWGTPALC